MADDFYPPEIRQLPEADITFPGVRGWLLQGPQSAVVFMDIAAIGRVPPHAHGAQWGVVVAGEMELSIGGQTRRYRPGDHYYIPAGTEHSAVFQTRTFVVDFFAERDRYLPRTIPQPSRCTGLPKVDAESSGACPNARPVPTCSAKKRVVSPRCPSELERG